MKKSELAKDILFNAPIKVFAIFLFFNPKIHVHDLDSSARSLAYN